MKAAEFAELLQLSHEDRKKLKNIEITDVVQDTRQISAGCCFVAIKGLHFNGNEHAQEAINGGAQLVVVDEPVSVTDDSVVITVPNTHKRWLKLALAFLVTPAPT